MNEHSARDRQVSAFHSTNENGKRGLCNDIFYNTLVEQKITSLEYDKLLKNRPHLLTWENFLFQYIIRKNTQD